MVDRNSRWSSWSWEEMRMTSTYNVVDADGHILEPLDLWDKYMDPAFRDRAPRIVKEADGRERLVIEEQSLGSKERGIGAVGGAGAARGGRATDPSGRRQCRRGGRRAAARHSWQERAAAYPA